jgi:outer membrane protein OmpA-like peptidoglycan-associated protein
MVQSQTRPFAGLMMVAAASLGLVGLSLPATATATATAGAAPASIQAVATAWFHDPISAAGRRAEIPVPADPAGYTGALRPTAATFRTHRGSLAVPIGWASGHTIEAPEALALTKLGLFAFDSPTLSAAAIVEIGQLHGPLARVRRVRCEGYTDFGGPAAHQQVLSLERAQAVCALVQQQHPGLTTFSVGYGGNDPVVVGGTPAERAPNRRVVLVATVSTPGPTVPGAPHLSLAVAGDATAEVTFSAPARDGGTRVTGYRLSTDGGSSWHPVRPAPSGPGPYTITLDGLINGTSYPVTIEARNAVGVGPSSPTLEVTPRGSVHVTVASAPILTAASPGDTTATITFAAPISDGGAAITAYQASTDTGTTWTPVTITGPGPYQATLTGLTDGTTYPVTIRAVNTAGDSPASNSLDVTPAAVVTVATAPSLTVASPGDTTATITFSAPTSDGGAAITAYQASTDAGTTWTTVMISGPGPYQATLTGLTDGTTYPVTVRAVNTAGDSPASNSLNVTPTVAPTVPGAPVITGGTPDYGAPSGYAYADLTFTDPTSDGGTPLTGYQYSEDGGTTWMPLTYVAGTPDTAQVEVVESDPCAPYSYTFLLEAINGVGSGPSSNAQEVDFNVSSGPFLPNC